MWSNLEVSSEVRFILTVWGLSFIAGFVMGLIELGLGALFGLSFGILLYVFLDSNGEGF